MAWKRGRRDMVRLGLLPLLLATLLAACTGAPPPNPRVPPPGGSDAFEEGYVLGCLTGYGDAGRDGYESTYRRDDRRYATEVDYRMGWDKGHQACYEDEKRYPLLRGERGGRFLLH